MRATLRAMADGDGRYVLNMAEQIFAQPPADTPVMDGPLRRALLARRAALYDKDREEPLQSDLRAAQVAARLRSRRRALRSLTA